MGCWRIIVSTEESKAKINLENSIYWKEREREKREKERERKNQNYLEIANRTNSVKATNDILVSL